jgi:hypothetical protein
MFFFRKPKLVVDAFTSENFHHAFDYAPVDYATKFYPEWWKKLPELTHPIIDNNNVVVSKTNMKYCEGLTSEYRNSIIIPLWSDFMFKCKSDGSWTYNFSDRKSFGEQHPIDQRIGFKENYLHFKIISPWSLKSDKNVYFQTTTPYYNYSKELEYENIPGTLEFYYQCRNNINLFVKNKPTEFSICHGSPLIHIKPLSERNLVLKKHLLTNTEYERKFKTTQFTYNKLYLNKKSIKKDNENEKKCPFGFGK